MGGTKGIFRGRKTMTESDRKQYDASQDLRKKTNQQYSDMQNSASPTTGEVVSGSAMYNKLQGNGEIRTDTGEYYGKEGKDWTEDKNGNIILANGKSAGPRYSTMLNDVEVTGKGTQNINKSDFGKELGHATSTMLGAPGAAVGEILSGDFNWGNLNSSHTQMNSADRWGMGTRGADGRMYGDNIWQKGVNGALTLISDPSTYIGAGLLKNSGVGLTKAAIKTTAKNLPKNVYRYGKDIIKAGADDVVAIGKNIKSTGVKTVEAVANPKAFATDAFAAGKEAAKNAPINMLNAGKNKVAKVSNMSLKGTADAIKTEVAHASKLKNIPHTIHSMGNKAAAGFVADEVLNEGKVGHAWDNAKDNEYLNKTAIGRALGASISYGRSKANVGKDLVTGHFGDAVNGAVGVIAHDVVGKIFGNVFGKTSGVFANNSKMEVTTSTNSALHHILPGGSHGGDGHGEPTHKEDKYVTTGAVHGNSKGNGIIYNKRKI